MHWIKILVLYMCISLVLHSLVCNTIKWGSAFIKFLIIGSVVGLGLLWHGFIIYGYSLELVSMSLTYAFLCELYIFIFTFVSSSISVSIILNIHNGINNINLLSKAYSGKKMVTNRIKRLESIGLLEKKDLGLFLSNQGMMLIERFNMLQRFFKLDNANTNYS